MLFMFSFYIITLYCVGSDNMTTTLSQVQLSASSRDQQSAPSKPDKRSSQSHSKSNKSQTRSKPKSGKTRKRSSQSRSKSQLARPSLRSNRSIHSHSQSHTHTAIVNPDDVVYIDHLLTQPEFVEVFHTSANVNASMCICIPIITGCYSIIIFSLIANTFLFIVLLIQFILDVSAVIILFGVILLTGTFIDL